jgi:hypothetical protein
MGSGGSYSGYFFVFVEKTGCIFPKKRKIQQLVTGIDKKPEY